MAEFPAYIHYSEIGDMITVLLCFLCHILIYSTYATERTASYRIFHMYFYLVLVGALSSFGYHTLIKYICSANVWAIYALHFLTGASFTMAMCDICLYILMMVGITGRPFARWQNALTLLYVIYLIETLALLFTGYGFHIDEDLNIHENYYASPFWLNYFIYLLIAAYIMLRNRSHLITHIFRGIIAIWGLSIILVAMELVRCVDSYTSILYAFPMLMAMFFFHFNAFDSKSGCLSANAFDGYVSSIHGKAYSLIFLNLPGASSERLESMSNIFFHFNEKYYRSPFLFKMNDGKFALVFLDEKNPNAETETKKMLHDFEILYHQYQLDYKIVLMHSHRELADATAVLKMEQYLEERTPLNGITYSGKEDVEAFERQQRILDELQDIQKRQNLNDPRVLVYCQPVFDLGIMKFNTAEALMRMQLENLGFVFPDQFIPLAEANDYIHVLSKIILNKTCAEIRRLLDEGFAVERVSVNFSMMELQNPDFCTELLHIIGENGIPYHKIAIEFTESKNEKDFRNVKNIMSRLSKVGIKFYLDDFGTDYSNLERIAELPFDIIKFDRSLTIMSGKNAENYRLVSGLAGIFSETDYRILFEGVETEEDVARCAQMKADYLQGYYYSRPIPIEKLRDFFSKEV